MTSLVWVRLQDIHADKRDDDMVQLAFASTLAAKDALLQSCADSAAHWMESAALAEARLAAIRAALEPLIELEKRATPGEWAIDPDYRPGMNWNNHIVRASDPNMTICFMAHDGTQENEMSQADAELIAALRNLLPALLAAAGDKP